MEDYHRTDELDIETLSTKKSTNKYFGFKQPKCLNPSCFKELICNNSIIYYCDNCKKDKYYLQYYNNQAKIDFYRAHNIIKKEMEININIPVDLWLVNNTDNYNPRCTYLNNNFNVYLSYKNYADYERLAFQSSHEALHSVWSVTNNYNSPNVINEMLAVAFSIKLTEELGYISYIKNEEENFRKGHKDILLKQLQQDIRNPKYKDAIYNVVYRTGQQIIDTFGWNKFLEICKKIKFDDLDNLIDPQNGLTKKELDILQGIINSN